MNVFNHKIKSGVTLLEIITVIIIIGVLATLGIPGYMKFKERYLVREAIANLKLVAAAERIYHLEWKEYFTSGDIGAINSVLGLSLSEASWDYSIAASGSGASATFNAEADRTLGPYGDCKYTVDNNDPENPTPWNADDCP